jgi:1-acyl-sn-glycerol-3-phosphate acyltransferase
MISLQTFACLVAYPYFHGVYRIRAWRDIPKRRGATLLIANHQHDNDDKVTVTDVQFHSQLRKTIYIISGRRLFEPGFMARKWLWLEWLMRTVNTGALFRALGMVPIENEIRSRAFVSFAHAVLERHGDLPLTQVFTDEALERLPPDLRAKQLSALFEPEGFRVAAHIVLTIRALREPYRGELIEKMRGEVERDMVALERLLRSGETLWLTPEGRFTKTGAMGRFRAALWRLWPVAESVYVIGISYDAFVGGRLSMLFRVVPPADRSDPVSSLAAARPVTVSQLLADWLESGAPCSPALLSAGANSRPQEAGTASTVTTAFTYDDALQAVQAKLAALPAGAWVDPELLESPARMTRAALDGLVRLGILAREQVRLRLTDRRKSPHFPEVPDIIAHQTTTFRETIDALARIAQRATATAAVST